VSATKFKKMHSQENLSTPQILAVGNTSEAALHNSPAWKRAVDIGFILLAAPVVLPMMAIIAIYIKCVSKGAVLFKQERVGYKGQAFTCYKFRSMKPNADVRGHKALTTHLIKTSDVPMIKLDATGDSRLIPFGAILRASGLDELPQLWNVLRGEMSLVGPRPCVRYEYEQYLDWQKKRFNVAPGLTGLWQVSGKNMTTFNEMINLDIEYGRRRSLALDLTIIAKTIPALFELAYRTRQLKQAGRAQQSRPAGVFADSDVIPSK
jgi:lipopolysaccharide/colanic/teichoic acid biosynthesis glycosyltransferase